MNKKIIIISTIILIFLFHKVIISRIALSAFEKWMNLINKMEDNTGEQDPAVYQPDAYVHQLDRDGSTLRTYKFHDVFPTQVSQIDLSYETTDAIEEFTVEFQVQ